MMKSLIRDVRNKFFYENAENLVRDATSNNNEIPSPLQLKKIGDACAYPDSYTLVFAQLHRRLTHLEYKRHVVKALLVLDYLVRLKPPSLSVQLKLIVDLRENWNDIYRLAKLRTQSSSATIQQIQRIAERLCEFIWRFEQGEVEGAPAEEEEEKSAPPKKKKIIHPSVKRKKKRVKSESESSSSSSSDSSSSSSSSESEPENEGGEGHSHPPPKDLLSPSRIPNFSRPAPVQAPPVSPFGFDFGSWSQDASGSTMPQPRPQPQPIPQQPKSAPDRAGANSDPFAGLDKLQMQNNQRGKTPTPASSKPVFEAVDWTCLTCTYVNPSDQVQCIMCATPRPKSGQPSTVGKLGVIPPAPLVISSPQSAAPLVSTGWACRFCSFHNSDDNSTVCHVCDHQRYTTANDFQRLEAQKQQMNTDGTYGPQHQPGADLEEKKESPPPPILSPVRTLGRGSAAGGISCSWCQYLNPPTAVRCEICDKDLGASAHAQRMKLQMQQQVQMKLAAQNQQNHLSWQCTNCTHINPPNTIHCVRCRFNPSAGLLPHQSASSVYAATASSASPAVSTPPTQPPSQPITQLGLVPPTASARLPVALPVAQPLVGSKPPVVNRALTTPSPQLSSQSQPTHGAASSTSVSANSSPAASPASSTAHSRAGSFSSPGPVSGVGAEYMPEHDLLELLMEQNENAFDASLVPVPGGHHPSPASTPDHAHKRYQSMVDQVAAMSVYNEVAEEIKQGKWLCAYCSYLNFPQDKYCEMCNQPKSGPGNPFAPSANSTTVPTETNPFAQSQPEGRRSTPQQFQPPNYDRILSTPQQTPQRQLTPQQQQQQQQSSPYKASPQTQPPQSRPLQQVSPQQPQPTQQQQQRPTLQQAKTLNPFDILQPELRTPSQPQPQSQPRPTQPQHQQPQPQQPSTNKPPQHVSPATAVADNKNWNCGTCTFMNPPGKHVCGMCEQPRQPVAPISIAATTNSNSSSRSRGSSPSQSGHTPGADVYSSLLQQGTKHSSSPMPLPAQNQAGKSPSLSGIVGTPPVSSLTLAPPQQPTRHRASLTGASGTPKMDPLQSMYRDHHSNQSTPNSAPATSGKKGLADTLPSNFKLDTSNTALPHAPGANDRDSSFNSFDPKFPVPDAFSHLHIAPGLKSPPRLEQEPEPQDRAVSFNSMFNSNADLLARKAVGHIPTPAGTVPPPHANDDFELKLEHHEGGLEVVGENGVNGEEDEEEGEVRPKRTKEEKAARKIEKEMKRAKRESKRAAKAQQAAEEERKRMEELALQKATEASLYMEVTPPANVASIPPTSVAPVADQPSAVKVTDPKSPTLDVKDAKFHPPLPSTPRPHLMKLPSNASSNSPSPPPPVPPMPVLSPTTLASLTVAPPPVKMDQAQLRQKVVDEIKSTEKLYVDQLYDVINNFMEPMKKNASKLNVTPKQIALIFSNLTVLAQFHSLFLSDLMKSDDNIIEVFVQLSPFLKMYTQYLNGYEKSIATINSLRANSKFQKFLEDKRDALKGRGLMTFLIMPVQRIPRYVLLLRELKRYTPPDHPELEQLNSAFAKIESIAEHVNESKRHVENMSKLLDIQNRLKDNKFVLFKPDRRLLREGLLKRLKAEYVLNDSSNRTATDHDQVDQLFFLFNDLLLWTTPNFDITGSVELTKLTCLPNQLPNMKWTISLGVRGQPYSADMVFGCKDQEEHDQWIRYLEAAILTANELLAHPGVRVIASSASALSAPNHSRSGSTISSSPSPAPPNVNPSPQPNGGLSASASSVAAPPPPVPSASAPRELEL